MLGTTKLGQRNTLLLAYCALLGAVVGCQIVAGIETRKVDPLDPGCVLPSAAGFPQVRIANFVPTSDVVDVCLRPAGASSWGRPVLLNGGIDDNNTGDKSCMTQLGAQGLAYTQVSVAFSAPAGSVDVKFIPGGSTCAADAISEGDGLTLATNAVNTLMNLGGNGVANQLVTLPEADTSTTNAQRLRVVHAAPGTGPIDFGITKDGAPPTTVLSRLLSDPISFGGTEPSGATTLVPSATLGDNGYLTFLTGAFFLGASLDADPLNNALFTFDLSKLNSGGGTATNSIYFVGVAGDNAHPPQAFACDEDAGVQGSKNALVIPCTPSALPSLSIDVFNPALYGPNSPYFVDRKATPVVPTAIAQRNSDVMCLVEVDEKDDRDNIILHAPHYGFNYGLPSTLDTQPTNPADQSGHVPTASTSPPCQGVPTNMINDALGCAEASCSTQGPGDPTGQLKGSTDCLVQNCPTPLVSIQSQNVACYDCLVVYIASDTTFEETQNNCTVDTRPPLGFDGQQNSMILSRFPLVNSDALVLTSTFYRRVILYSQLQLEDGQLVDFYCGFLSTVLNAQALPYAGNYGVGPLGNGGPNSSDIGWRNEQLWQAQQLINWVQQKSGGSNPAIIVGDWRSSKAPAADAGVTPPPGTFLPQDLAPDTMDLFFAQSAWTPVVDTTQGTTWGPQCSFCPSQENPYPDNATSSYFMLQPFIANWTGDPTKATHSESLIFNQNVFTPAGAPAGQLYPVSPYYGLNFTVIRPQH